MAKENSKIIISAGKVEKQDKNSLNKNNDSKNISRTRIFLNQKHNPNFVVTKSSYNNVNNIVDKEINNKGL